MTEQQKAKAYDEALERAKKYKLKEDLIITQDIFPELAESEDERMINAIKQMYSFLHNKPEYIGSISVKDIFAWLEKQESVDEIVERCKNSWYNEGKIQGQIEGLSDEEKYQQGWHDALEKQGEQKSADKVEPKFKVGDWVVYCGKTCKITGLHNGIFTITNQDGSYFLNRVESTTEPVFHLWTIQDANDGDVLATENFIFIFKNIDNGNGVHYYCQYEISKHEDDNQFDIALPQSLMGRVGNGISHYSPATKEQRDLLFQKMKEVGYVWDSEKKELKLLITNGGDFFESENCEQKHTDEIGNYDHKEVLRTIINEQKSAWSEGDDYNLQCMIAKVTSDIQKGNVGRNQELIDWLKSLKDRIGG